MKIVGTELHDELAGTRFNDVILGFGGNDVITTGLGTDHIDAGAGNDRILFTAQSETVAKHAGRIEGGDGYDTIDLRGVSGFTVSSHGHHLVLRVGGQSYSVSGVEAFIGTAGADVVTPGLFYTGPSITFHAGAGNDVLTGSGDYNLYGDSGDDSVYLFSNAERTQGIADGGTGYDTLTVGYGATVDLAAGTATIAKASYSITGFEAVAAYRDSVVAGSDGDDTVFVNSYYDQSDGSAHFTGAGGDDHLTGSLGRDVLDGGEGADVIAGGGGADTLTGGAGADLFVYHAGDSTLLAADRITDFEDGVDRIDLSSYDAAHPSADAFTFIGDGLFDATPGELRVAVVGPDTLIQADADGDGLADLTIRLTGQHVLTEASFIFATTTDPAPVAGAAHPLLAHELAGHLAVMV